MSRNLHAPLNFGWNSKKELECFFDFLERNTLQKVRNGYNNLMVIIKYFKLFYTDFCFDPVKPSECRVIFSSGNYGLSLLLHSSFSSGVGFLL